MQKGLIVYYSLKSIILPGSKQKGKHNFIWIVYEKQKLVSRVGLVNVVPNSFY